MVSITGAATELRLPEASVIASEAGPSETARAAGEFGKILDSSLYMGSTALLPCDGLLRSRASVAWCWATVVCFWGL